MITASAARTTSSVIGLGNSFEMSTPTSPIASTTAGLISLGGLRAGGANVDPPVGELVEQPGGHLAAPGVVDADEQDLGHVLGDRALDLAERPQPLTRERWTNEGMKSLTARRRSSASDSTM